MTIALNISLPSLASVTVWGLIIALTAYFSWHGGRLFEQRRNDAGIRKGVKWQTDCPHLFSGDPWMVPSHTDPRETIFKERRFFSGPYITEIGYQASDPDEVPLAA